MKIQPNCAKASYYPIQANWRKVGPVFRSEEAKSIWRPCMIEYAVWRAEDNGYPYKDRNETLPSSYDGCDWRFNHSGRHPAFWDYVCHSACHWLVDLNLFVAMKAIPSMPWRILSSDGRKTNHSTVWNGDMDVPILFDANFLALEVAPSEAIRMASSGRSLRPGQYLKAYLHQKLKLAA